MKCGECKNMRWFSDYALHYCGLSREVVTFDKDCNITDKEDKTNDKLYRKNLGKNKKDSTRL